MPARRYPPRRNAIEITPSPSTARRQAGRRVSARLRQLERAAEDLEVNISERLNRIRGILGGPQTAPEPDAETDAEPVSEPDPEPMNPTEQALRGRIMELELEVEDSKNEIARVRQSYEDWLDICPRSIIRDHPYRGAPRAIGYRPPTPPRPNNAIFEDVPPENIARMQQDFIDKAKITYQMAKEQYRKTLRKYQGIAEERDDQGRMYLRQLARQRIQHSERANRTFVEEPSRTASPDLNNMVIAYEFIERLHEDTEGLWNIQPIVREEATQEAHPPAARENCGCRACGNRRPAHGARMYLPNGATNEWKKWTTDQVADWATRFLEFPEYSDKLKAEDINGELLGECIISKNPKLVESGFPADVISALEFHFNAVFNDSLEC